MRRRPLRCLPPTSRSRTHTPAGLIRPNRHQTTPAGRAEAAATAVAVMAMAAVMATAVAVMEAAMAVVMAMAVVTTVLVVTTMAVVVAITLAAVVTLAMEESISRPRRATSFRTPNRTVTLLKSNTNNNSLTITAT